MHDGRVYKDNFNKINANKGLGNVNSNREVSDFTLDQVKIYRNIESYEDSGQSWIGSRDHEGQS